MCFKKTSFQKQENFMDGINSHFLFVYWSRSTASKTQRPRIGSYRQNKIRNSHDNGYPLFLSQNFLGMCSLCLLFPSFLGRSGWNYWVVKTRSPMFSKKSTCFDSVKVRVLLEGRNLIKMAKIIPQVREI